MASMKDFLQPAATFSLALAIASLGFTLPRLADAQITESGSRYNPVHVKIID